MHYKSLLTTLLTAKDYIGGHVYRTGNLLSGGDGLNGGLPGQIDPIVFEPQVLMTRDWSGDHIYKNGTIERIENAYGYWADSCYHYRITDYQGNVRAVISQNGVLEEVNAYYPYGGLLGAPATGVQARKYGGKELDRENGLDWYDSQARMYDPLIGRTTTQDPLAEKYYNLSPYLWCAGNPIRFVDKDGNLILFAQNSTSIFKDNFSIAYNYLHEHGASSMIDELIKSDNIYYIQETQEDSEFNPSTSTIKWNPYRALMTNTVYILTPAELLSHEFDHANSFDQDPEGTMKRRNETDEDYGNKEDKRVIQTSEQDVAKKLGRLDDNQKTREDHFGVHFDVPCPDSDDIITPTVVGVYLK